MRFRTRKNGPAAVVHGISSGICFYPFFWCCDFGEFSMELARGFFRTCARHGGMRGGRGGTIGGEDIS